MNKKFTLIGLLVVVAIIGILAALILPALGRAKLKAHIASCRSNLKNIGTVVSSYYTDGSDTKLPDNWLSTAAPMEIDAGLLSCPVTNSVNEYVRHAHAPDGEQYTGFGVSGLAQDKTGVNVHMTISEINVVYQDGSVHTEAE